MFLKILETCVYELDPAHFFACTWISMTSLFKENRGEIRIVN